MTFNKLTILLVSACMLTLSGCGKSSESTSSDSLDTTPTSTNTNTVTSEDTNSNTESVTSEDTNTDTTPGTDSANTRTTPEDTESTIPEPETYSITVVVDNHVTYSFGDLDLNKVLPEVEVIFTITAEPGYLISSVKLDDEILSASIDTYSFTMPNKDVVVTITSEEIPVQHKYFVIGKNIEHVNFNLFDKIDFDEGETVQFTYSAKQGYVVKGFEITRDDNGESVSYEGTSFIEFEMPASNVSVTFSVEQTYQITCNASTHAKITINPDKYYYEAGTEVSVTVSVTDDKYQLDSVSVVTENGQTVSTKLDGETYKFTMPSANVIISTVESEKPVEESNDPFTSLTTFQGKWHVRDGGGFEYDDYFRVTFLGEGKLSWYLTCDCTYDPYDEEWWANPVIVSGPQIQKAIPTGMYGNMTASAESVEYTYDSDTDCINFTAVYGNKNINTSLQLNRNGDSVTSLKVLNNIGISEHYYTKDLVLNKI